MATDGILNIFKPVGGSSYSVVSRLKRILGTRQIGHGGTLDPLASGGLPVFVNRATRLAEFMLEHPKTYIAGIELGIETTTYDREGAVVTRGDCASIERHQVEKALEQFRGDISQIPPLFSAVKLDGQPLYRAARQGKMVEVAPRPVHIYRLELQAFEMPYLRLEVECGRGTYIRSLAHDLGRVLGCGAILSSLKRNIYGPFKSSDGVTVADLEKEVANGDWTKRLFSLDYIVSHWPMVTLDDEQTEGVMNGQKLQWQVPGSPGRLRAYSKQGRLVALLFFDAETELWHPRKVFKPATQS